MSDAVISAVITGGLSLIGVIISNVATARRTEDKITASQAATEKQLATSQAIMETEIKELTREVREHNNFARRVPVIEEQIKVVNHRLADLESEQKG